MRIRLCSNDNAFKTLSLFLYLIFAGAACSAYSPAGYPGGTWVHLGRDTNGMDGTSTMGMVRQGVELLRLDNGQKFQVFGQYNWRYRNINQDYYTAYTPYLVAVYSFKYLDVGAEYGWPHYVGQSNGDKDADVNAAWFHYWDLKPWNEAAFLKALPISTWGGVAYDLINKTGSSTMGWVKQQAYLLWLPNNYMAGPFVSYDWRLRTRNADYFNYRGVSAGFEVGNGVLTLGAKYSWRSLPKINQRDRGIQLYFSVFRTWDLKPGADME